MSATTMSDFRMLGEQEVENGENFSIPTLQAGLGVRATNNVIFKPDL